MSDLGWSPWGNPWMQRLLAEWEAANQPEPTYPPNQTLLTKPIPFRGYGVELKPSYNAQRGVSYESRQPEPEDAWYETVRMLPAPQRRSVEFGELRRLPPDGGFEQMPRWEPVNRTSREVPSSEEQLRRLQGGGFEQMPRMLPAPQRRSVEFGELRRLQPEMRPEDAARWVASMQRRGGR